MRIAVCLIVLLATLSTTTIPSRAADQGVDGRLIGGIAAAVVAAGAAAVATYAAIRVNHLNGDDAYQSYRSNVPIDENACDRADSGVEYPAPAAPSADVVDLCDEGRALTIVQAVLIPVALLSGGTAAYLLATSPTVIGDESAVHVTPHVGHQSVGLDLSVAF
jgi:hypothetical protein